MCNYPKRIKNHSLETKSERYFQSILPETWTSEKPINDYGIDQRVEIAQEGNVLGLELLVQLKSSENKTDGSNEKIRLKISTYNYLLDKVQVVMLVKYVSSENRAYWIFLGDIEPPNQDQETFTVHIPKTNKLETLNWNKVYKFVKKISSKKLEARRNKDFSFYDD